MQKSVSSNNLSYDFQQSNTTKNINKSYSLTSLWSAEVLCTEHISMQLQQASLVSHLPWWIDAKMLLLQGSLSSKIIILKKKKVF